MQIIEIRYLWPTFNDFAIKNFTSFIAMTLINCKKTITAVFGTMALQLIEAFQCSVTYSMKCDLFNETNKRVFLTVAMLSLCVTAVLRYLVSKAAVNCPFTTKCPVLTTEN